MNAGKSFLYISSLLLAFGSFASAQEARRMALGSTAAILSSDATALTVSPSSLAGAKAAVGLSTRASFVTGEEGASGDGGLSLVWPMGGWTFAAVTTGQLDTWDHLGPSSLLAARVDGALGIAWRKSPGAPSVGLAVKGHGWMGSGPGLDSGVGAEGDLPVTALVGVTLPLGQFLRFEIAAMELGISMKEARVHGALAWLPGDLAVALSSDYAWTLGRLPLTLGFEWSPGKLPLAFRGSVEWTDLSSGRLDFIPAAGLSFTVGRLRLDYAFQFPTSYGLTGGSHTLSLVVALGKEEKLEPR